MELNGRKVVVIGMARSGVAAVRLLLTNGAMVRAVDEKPVGEVQGITVEPQTEAAFRDADLVVLSPGVPVDLDVLAGVRTRGIPVIGELELASPFLKGRTIGVTGTNGKTTTTALTGHILRESGIACQVGGNIGTPPAAMVETSRPDQWNVLELSSFQLETIRSFHAPIAACLNVTQNHLDRHHTFENYKNAKARLFETQRVEDWAVLNADDRVTVEFAARTPATVAWFSGTHPVSGAWLDGDTIRLEDAELLSVRDLRLRGRHNYENVMAAALMAKRAGAQPSQIAGAAATFAPVEHRLELVQEIDGVAYYNDSKATSVDATLKAIDAFPGGLWIILGGKDKDSDYTLLRDPLHAKAKAALLIGSAAPKIATQIADATLVLQCGTLAAAVQQASRVASPGDTVLLAPACASFDQFENFEQRGRVFKDLVHALAEGAN
ncbi:MAG TPA: UDP-N-acetylmuramoyl-L-alanine--D-glutamate ligase [Bryobacteraceae bacterium]|jgi:UDP-N-acetylmuramoylalanine--D-glutamate ligase|nr:UDP-N-acetylmuramoyl-L-alanine--D-glutamate ligase [Bryobacteraceae bacterium]